MVEDNDKDDNNFKDISALGLDRGLGFSQGNQGHRPPDYDDDDEDEDDSLVEDNEEVEDDDKVEDNNEVEDNGKDDNNFKDISAL